MSVFMTDTASMREILGDREAGGITYYGVGITEGTFSCRRLIREVICDFGWRVVE